MGQVPAQRTNVVLTIIAQPADHGEAIAQEKKNCVAPCGGKSRVDEVREQCSEAALILNVLDPGPGEVQEHAPNNPSWRSRHACRRTMGSTQPLEPKWLRGGRGRTMGSTQPLATLSQNGCGWVELPDGTLHPPQNS